MLPRKTVFDVPENQSFNCVNFLISRSRHVQDINNIFITVNSFNRPYTTF